jgi:hypothetical protein
VDSFISIWDGDGELLFPPSLIVFLLISEFRTNWLVMILAGASWIFIFLVKETYEPTLLRNKAAKMRKETGNEKWWSRFDEKATFLPLLKVNLSRPFVLMATEPIL